MEKGNIWIIVVSVKHRSAQKLIKQLVKKGFNPFRIVVVTNITNTEPLLELGIAPEHIKRKDFAGYAGALDIGAGVVVCNDPGASIIGLSTELTVETNEDKEHMGNMFSTSISVENSVTKRQGFIVGSKFEDGIIVCRAETIMTPFMKGLKHRGTTFKELKDAIRKFCKLDLVA